MISVRSVTALALCCLAPLTNPAAAQTELLAIEFNQDDQAGFDLWPGGFSGSRATANFSTDPGATSGTTTVTLTSNTGFGVPANSTSLLRIQVH